MKRKVRIVLLVSFSKDLNTCSLESFLPISTVAAAPPTTNQRKEELIRSFSSSVNTPIDFKQPKLPITIPTHLFFEQIKSSKRDANGFDSNEQPKKSKTSHTSNAFELDIKDDSSVTPTIMPIIKKEKPTAK